MDDHKITELVNERVVKYLHLTIKARDEMRTKLHRLEQALEENQTRKEALETQLGIIGGKIVDAAANGRDDSKFRKESREIKADLVEINGIIETLSSAIPQAQADLKNAEETLRSKVQECVKEIKPEIQKMFEDAILQADTIQAEWGQALSKLREAGMGVSDNPEIVRVHVLLANKDSAFHVLEKFIRG